MGSLSSSLSVCDALCLFPAPLLYHFSSQGQHWPHRPDPKWAVSKIRSFQTEKDWTFSCQSFVDCGQVTSWCPPTHHSSKKRSPNISPVTLDSVDINWGGYNRKRAQGLLNNSAVFLSSEDRDGIGMLDNGSVQAKYVWSEPINNLTLTGKLCHGHCWTFLSWKKKKEKNEVGADLWKKQIISIQGN